MGMFSGAAKLPPGNGQWAQLANFFPQDSGAGKSMRGGHHVDLASVLSALGGLYQPPPPPPPPVEFSPMPQPQFADLLSAPHIGQGQLMATPAQMAPYMWGR